MWKKKKKFLYCLNDVWEQIDLPDFDSLNALKCKKDQIIKWNGSTWLCANDEDSTIKKTDTLASLACSDEKIAKWNGSQWTCADDQDIIIKNTDTFADLNCSENQIAKKIQTLVGNVQLMLILGKKIQIP